MTRSQLRHRTPRASFSIAFSPVGSRDSLVIRDQGGGLSITNDAEGVILDLFEMGELPPGQRRRVFYFDSDGRLDELLHDDHGTFTGFAPGPRP